MKLPFLKQLPSHNKKTTSYLVFYGSFFKLHFTQVVRWQKSRIFIYFLSNHCSSTRSYSASSPINFFLWERANMKHKKFKNQIKLRHSEINFPHDSSFPFPRDHPRDKSERVKRLNLSGEGEKDLNLYTFFSQQA